MLVHTATNELPSPALTPAMLAWLEDDPLQEVCDAGAVRAEACLLDPADGPSHAVSCRHRFASREAFADDEAGPAESLRADGRARFGPETGVRMRRSPGGVRLVRGG